MSNISSVMGPLLGSRPSTEVICRSQDRYAELPRRLGQQTVAMAVCGFVRDLESRLHQVPGFQDDLLEREDKEFAGPGNLYRRFSKEIMAVKEAVA